MLAEFKDFGQLPRPPKDLRVAELWGVSEDLLHNPALLKLAVGNIAERIGLHMVSDQEPVTYNFSPKGVTYVAILEESHLAGHTYYEQGGHFELQLATCSPTLDLDPLADICSEVFKPKGGGWVFQKPYTNLNYLNRLMSDPNQNSPFLISEVARVWWIPPYLQKL